MHPKLAPSSSLGKIFLQEIPNGPGKYVRANGIPRVCTSILRWPPLHLKESDINVPPNRMKFELPPAVDFCSPIKAAPPPHDPKQDNCSALAWHLLSHVKRIRFNTKAEVAKWCWSHIGVDIIWQSNSITLMNTASTKLCHLRAAKRMVINHYFNHQHQHKEIINLKNELRGICTCKQDSYGSCNPTRTRKGCSDEGWWTR